MKIKQSLHKLQSKLWFLISFILITLAFLLLDLAGIISIMTTTSLIMYGVVFILSAAAIYARQRHDKNKKRLKDDKRKA